MPVVDLLTVLLPSVVVLLLAFNSGGTFPGATGFGALVVLLALLARVALTPLPFAGFGWVAALAMGCLGLLGLWTLASIQWSDAPIRGLLDADRVLLYLGVLTLMASVGWSPAHLRRLLRGLLVVTAIVTLTGLASRLFPGTFHVELGTVPRLLSFPVSYWNGLAAIAATATLLALHCTCDEREAVAVRVLAALAAPALIATIVLTDSRGAMGAVAAGAALYVIAGHPRAALSGLIATVPACAFAGLAARDASALFSTTPTSPAAIADGHAAATRIVLACLAAAGLRLALTLVDRRLAAIEVSQRARRSVSIGLAVAAVVAVGVGSAVALSSDWAGEKQDSFAEDNSNSARLAYWNVALDAWREQPVRGTGAGTWELRWELDRETKSDRFDAHGLYVEILGELGGVGGLLLVLALGTGIVALALRVRSTHRAAAAAATAVVVCWAIQAGVDFLWEVSATSVPVFAIIGLAVARPARAEPARAPAHPALRAAVAVALLAVAVFPARVAVSASHLDSARTAFNANDCAAATRESRSSLDWLGRPEPWEIIAFCRAAEPGAPGALAAISEAAERDPHNWRYRYSRGLIRAAAGQDPKADLESAHAINPVERDVIEGLEELRTLKRSQWRRWGLESPLPTD